MIWVTRIWLSSPEYILGYQNISCAARMWLSSPEYDLGYQNMTWTIRIWLGLPEYDLNYQNIICSARIWFNNQNMTCAIRIWFGLAEYDLIHQNMTWAHYLSFSILCIKHFLIWLCFIFKTKSFPLLSPTPFLSLFLYCVMSFFKYHFNFKSGYHCFQLRYITFLFVSVVFICLVLYLKTDAI